MAGNYRKGMSTIIRYYHIKINLANGKIVEGIRESDLYSKDLVERIYKNKAEVHFKETYVTEILVTELSSQSIQVKLYIQNKKQ
jgi:hypothetical protein